MASITVRNLPEETKRKLRIKAAEAGVSLEAYLRGVLEVCSLTKSDAQIDILTLADTYFGKKYGIDLDLPERGTHRQEVVLD